MARTASTTVITDANGVARPVRIINVSKKLETPTGSKIERKAVVNVLTFNTLGDLQGVYSESELLAFAQSGIATRARAIANGQLMSGSLDDEGKKLLKSFRESLATVTDPDIMGMSKADGVKFLLAKDKFKNLEDTLKQLETTEALAIDFVSAPVPVAGDNDDDADNDEGEA